MTPNWIVSTGARYDIEAGKFDQARIGIGYIDDCFAISLNYITDFTFSGNVAILDSVGPQANRVTSSAPVFGP